MKPKVAVVIPQPTHDIQEDLDFGSSDVMRQNISTDADIEISDDDSFADPSYAPESESERVGDSEPDSNSDWSDIVPDMTKFIVNSDKQKVEVEKGKKSAIHFAKKSKKK